MRKAYPQRSRTIQDLSEPGPGKTTRMAAHGDLKLLLLALIAQQPRHGYELIRLLSEMFAGHYAPSPGSIYPLLSQLETAGHIAIDASHGMRKRYRVAAGGEAWLDAQRSDVEAAWQRLRCNAKRAIKEAAPPPVRAGMHALKHALHMQDGHWSEAQAERVAAILRQAAAAIAAELAAGPPSPAAE